MEHDRWRQRAPRCKPVAGHWQRMLCATLLVALATERAAGEIDFRSRTDIKVGSAPTDLALLRLSGPRLLIADDGGLVALAPLDSETPLLTRIGSKPFAKSLALAPLIGSTALDVAYLAGNTPALFVAAGDTGGGFGAATEIPIPARPRLVRTKPLDTTERAGVLVAHDAGVTLLLPDRGTLRAVQVLEGPIAAALDAADLDGDGVHDVIVADPSGDRVLTLHGRRDGTFDEPQSLPSIRRPSHVLAADADGDRRPDLIVVGSGGIAVHLRDLRGDFRTPTTLWTQAQLTDVAAADLDRDGRLDLAVTTGNRAMVTFLMGAGDGTFDLRRSYTVGSGPTRVLLGDVTGDAIPDALVLNHVGDSVTLLRGLGTGEFDGSGAIAGTTNDFSAMALADFDTDTHLDIAVTSEQSGNVSVYLGNGRGEFAGLPPTTVARQPRGLVTSDLNRDRLPDLAVTSFSSDKVAVLTGTGHGNFTTPQLVTVGLGPSVIVSGDFQGRGIADLAVANTLSDTVSILYGDGRAGFPRVKNFPVARRPTFLLVGDLNHDRHDDLVVGNDYSDTVSILRGNGQELGEPRTDRLAGSARALVAEDFDRDGNTDLVLVNEAANAVDIMPGRGVGKFGDRISIPVGQEPHRVSLGDFNEDGALDIAVLHREPPSITILINRAAPARTTTPQRG